MILISPRGKEVEFDDNKAEKFLNSKSKIRQGWKKKEEKPKAPAKPKKKVIKSKKKVNG